MARLAILSAAAAFLFVLADVVVGFLVGHAGLTVRGHAYLAVPTSVLTLFAWLVVGMYFVGHVAWAREEVAAGRLDAVALRQAIATRRAVLPWVMAAVAVLIAAYVLGGGADVGSVPVGVHLGLALLALGLHLVCLYRTILGVGLALELARGGEPAS
jgi:hypothetical protein